MKQRIEFLLRTVLITLIVGCTIELITTVSTTKGFSVYINWSVLHLPVWVIVVGTIGLTSLFLGFFALLAIFLDWLFNLN
jgi:hypothetical protein